MRRGVTLGATLLVIAGAGLEGCQGAGSGSAAGNQTTIKVAFKQNETLKYRFHTTTDGTLTAAGATQPVKADMSADAGWRVAAVDASGVASVEATLTNIKGTVIGAPQQGSTTQTTTDQVHLQFKVSPDGQIAGQGAGQPGVAPGTSAPGGDQLFAILPDHPVKPGDTWTKDYNQPNPFGTGTINRHTQNRYTKDAIVNGHKDAVIDSTSTTPVDLTIDLARLAAGLNPPPPNTPGGLLHERGSVNATSTTWVDRSRHQFDKTSASADVDLTESLEGGQLGASGPIHFTGKQTVELDRMS